LKGSIGNAYSTLRLLSKKDRRKRRQKGEGERVKVEGVYW
jgi:hypothetical protein